GVTPLGDGGCGECERLAAVKLPEGLLSLGFGCFYGCGALQEIDLPQTLQKIGKSAFYGCSELKIVKIGKDQESISAFAFAGCPAITDIYVAAVEPPVAPESVFSAYTATLHVPQGTIEAYAADSTWGLFSDIQAYDSGVVAVVAPDDVTVTGNTVNFGSTSTDAVVEIVGVDGRIVYHGAPASVTLAPGTYIIHTPATTLKVNI
ncbi:MAG: leucine-rich repeat domain-containing protein, partial [Muribaculaceae bacterium]|nr:leucine-rich repeat domain-containing protein [Muribaculaceae bacterium]